ncbi:hypothetical protein SRHO_G00089070 [Serrasalmus rhombeus]
MASGAAAGCPSAWSENTLINNNPPYTEASLDNPRIEVLPSSSKEVPPQPKSSKSDEDEDKDTDGGGPITKMENLLLMRKQASSHIQAQKKKHLKELSLKKDKLQKLLLKLDSRETDHDKHSSQQSQSESTETPTSIVTPLIGPGEPGWEKKAPADRQRDDSSEADCSTDDRRVPGNVSTDKKEDSLDNFIKRLNLYMHHCWRRVFQSISVPLIITSVFIIELLSFLMQTLFKGLVVELVAVVGEQVILPLTEAVYYRTLQPLITCLTGVTAGIRNLLQPILEIVDHAIQYVAQLIQAFRLVQINNIGHHGNTQNV